MDFSRGKPTIKRLGMEGRPAGCKTKRADHPSTPNRADRPAKPVRGAGESLDPSESQTDRQKGCLLSGQTSRKQFRNGKVRAHILPKSCKFRETKTNLNPCLY